MCYTSVLDGPWSANDCSKKGCLNLFPNRWSLGNTGEKPKQDISMSDSQSSIQHQEGFQMALRPTAVSFKLTLQKATVFEIAS